MVQFYVVLFEMFYSKKKKKEANHVGLSYFIFTQTNREHCHNLFKNCIGSGRNENFILLRDSLTYFLLGFLTQYPR